MVNDVAGFPYKQTGAKAPLPLLQGVEKQIHGAAPRGHAAVTHEALRIHLVLLPFKMTAKTLEKVNVGGFVHPAAEGAYPVEDITSVAVFNGGDLGGHYEHLSAATGEVTRCL